LNRDTIPEYVWRKGTLYDPCNEYSVMSAFLILPEYSYTVHEILPVNTDENVSDVFLVKVEEKDLNLEENDELFSFKMFLSMKPKICQKLLYVNTRLN